MKKIFTMISVFLLAQAIVAAQPAKVHFVKPHDKEVVSQTFTVEFGVEGMKVEKAGEVKEKSGHHHLIIDGKPVAKGQVIPKDDMHKHFGKGETSTEVTLKPGKHTLTLQFADGAHKSYGEEYSSTIEVEVK